MAHHIVYTDATMCLATCGRAFINAWFKSPDAAMLRMLQQHHRAYVATHTGKHAVVSLIEANIGRTLAEDARLEARAQAEEMITRTFCHCFIVLGTGFYAATVRGIISGIQWFSRTPVPWKVFGDIGEGARWIATHAQADGHSDTAADLRAAIEATHRAAPAAQAK